MPAQYETVTLGVSDLDRIKLPKFQRGFVWNDAKKNEFVQTLHEGFPFGALLVYPESEETGSKLLLLDGQQRLSTIRQYKDNPLKFWKSNNLDIYRQYLTKVNELLGAESDPSRAITEQIFDRLVIPNNNPKYDLADWADEVSDDRDIRKALRDTIKELREIVRSYVNLDDLSILAIKFTGQKDHIADVFANLNKGGMPLSKYEIYSASWINTEISLLPAGESSQQDAILDLVKDYYIRMDTEAEFELNNFSEDDFSRKRCITLSELGTALGAFVQKKLPSLISDSPTTANEIGFGLLGIATGVDNRQLGTLNSYVDDIKRDLQIILETTERISTNLQVIFDKLLKRMYASKTDYERGLSSTFKTLSYFAALWSVDPNSTTYMESLRNIRAYFVYDFWTKSWTSHGDQRLSEFYPKNRKRSYELPLSQDKFAEAFKQWIADSTPGINFAKETKALVTMHANLSYLSGTVSHGEPFELEHIIARKKINAVDDPNNRAVFGSSLGNCMYLPKSLNNKKKDLTLYDVNVDGRYNELIKASLYPTKNELDRAFKDLESHQFDDVNTLISHRARVVADDLINKLLKD